MAATDKRIIKTKKAITTAFMELSLEKDMRKITVSDIAERAVINRSTFYLHYNDTKDVLDDIERDISETVYTCLSKFDTGNVFSSTYDMLVNLTGILDANPAFKNFMLHSTSSAYIISNIKTTLIERALQTTKEKNKDIDESSMKFAIYYMVSGIVDAYIRWATDEAKSMGIEQFCRNLTILTEATIGVLK